MTYPDSYAVVAAYADDPRGLHPAHPLFGVIEPFIGALPTLLADMLGQPVTIVRLAEAKRRYCQNCLDNDIREHATRGMIDANTASLMVDNLQSDLELCRKLKRSVQKYLRRHGLTAEEFFIGTVVFSDDILALVMAGRLTFADLLLRQPSVFPNQWDE